MLDMHPNTIDNSWNMIVVIQTPVFMKSPETEQIEKLIIWFLYVINFLHVLSKLYKQVEYWKHLKVYNLYLEVLHTPLTRNGGIRIYWKIYDFTQIYSN